MPMQGAPASVGASGKANWEMTGPGQIEMEGAVPRELKGMIPTDPAEKAKGIAKPKANRTVAIVLIWLILLVICVMAVSYVEKLI